MNKVVLTYKYRLLPTRAQHAALSAILEQQRQLYNAALQERVECYRKTGGSRSWGQQCRSVTSWLGDDPAARLTYRGVYDLTLRRLHRSYEAFFRRLKAGKKPGFPRFKSGSFWESFGTTDADDVRLKGRGLRFQGVPGTLRMHMHREFPGNARSLAFRRVGRRWWVCLSAEAPVATANDRSAVGLDLGLSAFVALSNGEIIPAPQIGRKAYRALRIRQRALARCVKGSNRRRKVRLRLARVHERTANERRTFLHQRSAAIVANHGLIAVEKLNIGGMARARPFARSIHDAGWATFVEMLRYKAAKAGSRLIEVDPRNTSQACSGCGVIVPKTLAVRVHECPDCGLVLDRDVNAAINVLHKGVTALGALKTTDGGASALGNIKGAIQ